MVTGSSRGLSAALTEHLADQGWNVVACVRTESAAVSIKRAGVEPVLQDVRAPVSEALLAAVRGRPIDALINNAGIGAPARPLADCDPQTILNAVDVNVAGPMRLTQAMLPMLLAAPAPLIINVSSPARFAGCAGRGRLRRPTDQLRLPHLQSRSENADGRPRSGTCWSRTVLGCPSGQPHHRHGSGRRGHVARRGRRPARPTAGQLRQVSLPAEPRSCPRREQRKVPRTLSSGGHPFGQTRR
ncbi:SDR family NAD(P)-dependent oxidoreductase [Micromonospora coriariae]|uniref:SDR family NAD(P)-dependent oxidoreductase n=1 Tax=Micromonospora coriariae TaxID=285665 RepID=UPI0038CBF987